MRRAAATLVFALVLAQAQLLFPCGRPHGPYFSSGVWHQGYYVSRWCPVLPPHT